MTTRALAKLALIAELPSSGRPERVDIVTMWGWHYLIETDDDGGTRKRLICRVSIDGSRAQSFPSEFDLPAKRAQAGFQPTLKELGIRGLPDPDDDDTGTDFEPSPDPGVDE